jgi:hypothetical protein
VGVETEIPSISAGISRFKSMPSLPAARAAQRLDRSRPSFARRGTIGGVYTSPITGAFGQILKNILPIACHKSGCHEMATRDMRRHG